MRCKTCGLVFAHPPLTTPNASVAYGEAEAREYLSELAEREKQFDRLLDVVKRFTARGRLLDVGGFVGVFLNVARMRGWRVTGLEPPAWDARSPAIDSG
ncbi:MAG: hypothetical protein HY023_15110 [Chloroflexi bacterium]|nr:hypothetical protein [Chloroflexota bacterium]